MEPPGGLPPDRDRQLVLHQQPNIGITASAQNPSLLGISTGSQQTLERLSRPLAFDKMEALVREMQDPEHGVPVRQQKMFLTSIPYAFMGYDLIEWLMDRLSIEESEALNIANQLCLHGYFFPVNDTKTLVVKDDSSLYRFQTPYYWPWQHKAPDNVEYAIYLAKRSLRNKQRHGLEDYESDALASLHKNLKGKWDFISMQAEEQVRLAKERKKGDKIVGDSQERAYWRVHRPPPGQFTPLEPCPVPSRDRQGIKPKKKTVEDYQREVDYLEKSLNRTRIKMSQACESLVVYSETFSDYDFFLQPVLPSNPWVTEDTTFWQLNNALVDIPTEKRVRRWAISIEELVSDPTGLQEFTTFLEKEYSHENIRFWIAVNRLRRSAHSKVAKKVNEIYEEFLKPGAPCEINIDGKTMEIVQKGLKNPSRFTFDAAAEHIYMLLLKKDCYPRFIRSEHYKNLVATGIQPSHKKRFFNFGGVGVKKKSSAATSNHPSQPNLGAPSISGIVPPPGNLSRRRGSDRSLSGSAHELAVIGVKDVTSKVPHSHSQSNLSEIPYSETIYRGDMPTQSYGTDISCRPEPTSETLENACLLKSIHRDMPKPIAERLETTHESSAVCPWETNEPAETSTASIQLSVCPWEAEEPPLPQPKTPILISPSVPVTLPATTILPQSQDSVELQAISVAVQTPEKLSSITTDIGEVSERMRRSCGLRQQNTVDSDYASKRLMANITEQRRASMTITPRTPDYERLNTKFTKISSPPATSIVGGGAPIEDTTFPPLYSKTVNNMDEAMLLKKLCITDETRNIAPISIPTVPTSISTTAEAIIATTKTIILTATTTTAISAITQTPTPLITTTTKPIFIFHTTTTTTTTTMDSDDNRDADDNNDKIGNNLNNVKIDNVDVMPLSSSISDDDVLNKTQPNTKNCENLINNNNNCNNDNDSININNDNLKMQSELELNLNEIKIKSKNNLCTAITIHVECPTGGDEQTPTTTTTKTTKATTTIDNDHIETVQSGDNINAPALISPMLVEDPNVHQLTTKEILSEIDEQNEEKNDEDSLPPEELSPTTEEYQEGIEFVHQEEGCVFDMDDDVSDEVNIIVGCVAPAPTPAPTLAPLAEIETDAVDDELDSVIEPKPIEIEETKKKRKKRGSDAKKLDDNKSASGSGQTGDVVLINTATASDNGGQAKSDESNRNAVCPWEDEDVTASDATFVKTYATLGYL